MKMKPIAYIETRRTKRVPTQRKKMGKRSIKTMRRKIRMKTPNPTANRFNSNIN